MVDDAALARLFSVEGAAWSATAILALMAWRMWNGLPAVMAQWIAWLQARATIRLERERALAEGKAADFDRLRDEVRRLADRVAHLEGKVEECEADRMHWMGRAIKAESYNEGIGEAEQRAQLIVSSERQRDAEQKKP